MNDVDTRWQQRRHQSAHTYNKETADEISRLILSDYFSLFKAFEQKMTGLPNGD
ncbi:MAG TPA: hypothetical protein VF670_00240 [Duganella sp.]|jgi:hypothetical protein